MVLFYPQYHGLLASQEGDERRNLQKKLSKILSLVPNSLRLYLRVCSRVAFFITYLNGF